VSYVYAFDQPLGMSLSEAKAVIGGKAANLSVMATELRLPVPPGFVISTAACNAYLAGGWPEGLDAEIREHMRRVEAVVGRRFGDATDPLLVSVRSGAPVSMPGMMDTILNLGLNDATARGLAAAAGDAAFAQNCHERFVGVFKDIVGADDVPEDPWFQLRAAVEAVFRSWNSDRAKIYRRREWIADDLGTAVTVQTMVFGNRGNDSATGVLFTRNPATGENTIYGDILFNAQGEDVVAGTHRTEPLSALDERLPAVGAELRRYAHELERHYADLCDIEFTIERGKLWMLQVRVGKRTPQAALRMAVEMAETDGFPLTKEAAVRRVLTSLANPPRLSVGRNSDLVAIATGLPASPGVASGEILTSPDAAAAAAEAGRRVILVRAETSPDDVHGMAKAAGVLTSKGGLASHAAVVARGWGIPAVVGASALQVREDGVTVNGRTLACGETITIDGTTGEVFVGAICGEETVVPEAATLIRWARELGIEIPAAAEAGELPVTTGTGGPAAAPTEAAASASDEPPTEGDVIRRLLVKGPTTVEVLADTMLCQSADLAPLLAAGKAAGLVETVAGAFRLTADGKLKGQDLIAADRDAWGVERAVEALDTFIPFDHRMKDTVTAWQVREVDGAQAINDHTDPAYDAEVIGRLTGLHQDASAWLGDLAFELPRLGGYRARLDRALALACGGDGRYVASPRVESYHGVWFELHEDLIRLSGRKRSDEVAAGRA
jgi:pyruvate,orthophosphate dikinase